MRLWLSPVPVPRTTQWKQSEVSEDVQGVYKLQHLLSLSHFASLSKTKQACKNLHYYYHCPFLKNLICHRRRGSHRLAAPMVYTAVCKKHPCAHPRRSARTVDLLVGPDSVAKKENSNLLWLIMFTSGVGDFQSFSCGCHSFSQRILCRGILPSVSGFRIFSKKPAGCINWVGRHLWMAYQILFVELADTSAPNCN